MSKIDDINSNILDTITTSFGNIEFSNHSMNDNPEYVALYFDPNEIEDDTLTFFEGQIDIQRDKLDQALSIISALLKKYFSHGAEFQRVLIERLTSAGIVIGFQNIFEEDEA